jgi:ABC-type multidrug transport system fused ATPase/permease subunit
VLRLEQDDHFARLEIEKLCFAYPGEPEIIHDLGLSIQKGETVGVVGGSGSGKTTLIDLLLGLLVPKSGHILRDSIDIHEDLRSWQQHIGYVQQSVFLLDASIRENIGFGIAKDEIDNQRVNEVIKLVKLDAWIETLKDGIDSVVGERGVMISGGQRQRIGLGRALYHNPDMLVLDEATSALDNLTEQQIMEDIYNMKGSRTLIIIAHRLDTIRRCDRIIVLDKGQIVGDGSYEELVADNKHFQMISLQSSERT